MATLTSLTESLIGQVEEHRSDLILTGLSHDADVPEESFVFQYFPETLQDTKAINHQRKEVPGGTLPIYQWINSGERLLSFTAIFASDVDLLAHGVNKAGEIYGRVKNAGLQRFSVDIRTALAYLRTFLFPKYGGDSPQGPPLTFAPRKCRLHIPRSGIGLNGGARGGIVTPDSVHCIMTQCEVTYQQFFTSGLPRIVEVNLAFAEVPQKGGLVEFPQTALSTLPAVSNPGPGGTGIDLLGALGVSAISGLLGSVLSPTGAEQSGLQPYTVASRTKE